MQRNKPNSAFANYSRLGASRIVVVALVRVIAICLLGFVLAARVSAASHIQQASSADITGISYTSFGATFGSATTAGNAIVIGITYGNDNVSITATDNQGNTYHEAMRVYDAGDNQGCAILYALNIKGGPTSVTLQFGSLLAYLGLGIHEYSGVAALDVTAGQVGRYGTNLTS